MTRRLLEATLRRGLTALACVGLSVLAAAAADGLYLTDPSTGRQVRVDHGDPVLHLVFFATWCPDCLAELETLHDYADRWSENGYRLVLVAVRERQTAERLQHFVEHRKPPGRVLFDPDGRMAESLGVDSVPTHVLLDANGKPMAKLTTADAAAEWIESALEGVASRDE